jgi:phosphohistidine phosphatase
MRTAGCRLFATFGIHQPQRFMKSLLLVRHAKSSWADPGQQDIDRPMNDRGKQDAPDMARRLKQRSIHIDLLVSSPAKRARKTAKLFAEELDIRKDDILVVDRLYLAGHDDFISAITSIDDKYTTIALFSHNPGITSFANSLTDVRLDNMPTASIFAVTANTQTWRTFPDSVKQFLFFDYPKKQMTD